MNGLIYIDKPKNYTSRDIVNIISKKLKTKKVGHTGTLDPIATGILIICVGKATKLVEIITNTDKTYEVEVTFGLKTDTYDITGNILQEKEVIIRKEAIEKVLKSFIKKYNQEVPIYSAVKVDGKKLYEYAREGKSVKLPKKEIEIKNIILNDIKYEFNKTIVNFTCDVSKGTYIRSLVNDISKELNTIGVMSELRRIKQGNITIDQTQDIEDELIIHNIEEVLNINTVIVDQELEKSIRNACILDNNYELPVLFKNKNNKLLAIYKLYEKDNTKIKPWKMLID